jgi:hypothetical protein
MKFIRVGPWSQELMDEADLIYHAARANLSYPRVHELAGIKFSISVFLALNQRLPTKYGVTDSDSYVEIQFL